MTVKFYISQNIERREKGFKYPAERENSLNISRLIWRQYRESDNLYAILFNIGTPPADMIIVTNSGVGVADLKDISGSISGNENNTWKTKSDSGGLQNVHAGTHKNPFVQVRQYRKDITEELQRMGGIIPGKPKWLIAGDFDVQASIVITGGEYDTDYLDIDPAKSGSWFTVRDTTDIADWAYSLSFKGRNQFDPYHLTDIQVETLARIGFRTREWNEMEDMLTNEEPYAFLWHCEKNGNVKRRYALIDRDITIGRDSSAFIQIENDVVGKHHATIKCEIAGVSLTDHTSKNGTFVNGGVINERYILHDRDQIVFGPCDSKSGISLIDGSYFLYTKEDKDLGSTKLWTGKIE